MALVNAIYVFVEAFSNTAKYGLRPQITSSAISIPSNIAKGASRNSEKDFARFLEIALGSAMIWPLQGACLWVGWYSPTDGG